MKRLFFLFAFLITLLQFQVWLGDNSVRTLNALKNEITLQADTNLALSERNRELEIEIVDLKTGVESIEERARSELGMIEKGETFFLIVE